MIKFLTSFRFSVLIGIILALWLDSISSVSNPIWSFVVWPYLYVILFCVILCYQLLLWIIMDKATLYDVKGLIRSILGDWFLCVLYFLCTVFFLFFVQTYI